MRAEDLHHEDLWEREAGRIIRFAGQRGLSIDAVARGPLRKEGLVESFRLTAARAALTQLGFSHGWRMAEALRAELEWKTATSGVRSKEEHW